MTTALCAIEWKKRYIPDRQILFQQAKNFRVNKCILRHILGLPLFEDDLIDSFIMAMDFKGFTGYMFRLDKKDDVFVANLISKLTIPLHLRLIPSFKSTLLHLISWTEHMVKLSRIVEVAIQKKNADASFDSITISSTKRTPDPTEFTYLSPKRSKT
ncbi:hypothetical protein BJV82DRAFT_581773 [Fennellomyces sp. T-0311]|nr:hypothetical protein BJV82DRAFT_581773 [Fennellomyces sp. T-0311]